MGSRHLSTTQQKVHNPAVTLIDSLSDQFEYLQVSTTSNNNNQDAHLTTTVSSHNNHNYGSHNHIQPLLDTTTKRPWANNANENSTNQQQSTNNRRHSSNPSPQQTNTQTSTNQPNGPQPLLQLMPHTPQQAVSPSNGALSPGGQQQAYFYGSSMAGYYATAPYPTYAGPNQRGGFDYQYPPYMATQQQYQWPMTNINFMPNLFVMAGGATGPSHPNFAMPPPPSFQQPMPLMKQSFRHGYQDANRRFNRPQSESARYTNGNRGNNGNGSHQNYRRQGSKTALCRNITELNHCSYGERCYFAHSADELKPKPANTKYKTVNCTAFTEKGNCPYGDKCHYIHPGEEDRPPTDPLRQ